MGCPCTFMYLYVLDTRQHIQHYFHMLKAINDFVFCCLFCMILKLSLSVRTKKTRAKVNTCSQQTCTNICSQQTCTNICSQQTCTNICSQHTCTNICNQQTRTPGTWRHKTSTLITGCLRNGYRRLPSQGLSSRSVRLSSIYCRSFQCVKSECLHSIDSDNFIFHIITGQKIRVYRFLLVKPLANTLENREQNR
jgi:hypothetical protein